MSDSHVIFYWFRNVKLFSILMFFLAFLCTLFRMRKMHTFLPHGEWHLTQLLIASIGFGCFFRCLSFSILCILDLTSNDRGDGNIVRYDAQPTTMNSMENVEDYSSLYNKMVFILFTLPYYFFISSF